MTIECESSQGSTLTPGDQESAPLANNLYSANTPEHLTGIEKDNDSASNTYGSTVTSSLQFKAHASAYPSQDDTSSDDMSRITEPMTIRRIAIDLSLYVNIIITFSKLYAYIQTMSLSVLAALTDSLLDVVSQVVLNYTERHSSKDRSSALYPAGAARLEPVGVLTCAALMGMASFEIMKESVESLLVHGNVVGTIDAKMLSVYGMVGIVFIKLALYFLCHHAIPVKKQSSSIYARNNPNPVVKQSIKVSDPTLEALAQDHWNDVLSNAVAAFALLAILFTPDLWFLDPVGALLISIYIIYSWYETGKEQIEQLTGKSAPDEFIDELYELASNFDSRMIVDVVRAYHFGPKFLVELEVVLPKDTLLFESHDLGMELQYEIEGREEVERCFVHIDYEQRPYDEHVVSKVPELRAKYRPSANSSYCHSV
jgi:cation diffusion facilitator family transporter